MTKKSNKRFIFPAIVLTFLVGVGILVGVQPESPNCVISQEPAVDAGKNQVAVVLGPTNNFVDIDSVIAVGSPSARGDLGESLDGDNLKSAIGNEISVIIADGEPSAPAQKSYVTTQGDTESDIRQGIEITYGVVDTVTSCAAGDFKTAGDEIRTVPESNILGAISIAADQFSPGKKHILYVFSNGIQTAGSIEMQTVDSFPRNSKVASLLAKDLFNKGSLPNLKGATVYWYGLGQADGTNQKILPQKAASSLTSFWQQVIAYSGGNLETKNIFGKVGSGDPHANAIKVSPVELKECKTVLYEGDGLVFKPGKASFVNLTKARAAAKKVAGIFKSGGCDEMVLTGFAAAGVAEAEYQQDKSEIDATNKSLTLARAQAFKTLVRAAGFQGEISTEGGGTCEDNQWNDDGTVDEAAQAGCRRVEVSN